MTKLPLDPGISDFPNIATLVDRTKNLKKRLGKDLADYPLDLTDFIFSDFLLLKYPLRKLLKVVATAKRVDRFISQNPSYVAPSSSRIQLFETWNISDKREILERYRVLVESNVRYKQTRDKVLSNLYPSIIKFLRPADSPTGINFARAYPTLIPLAEMEWLVSTRKFVDQVALRVAKHNPNITASAVKGMTYQSMFHRANTYDIRNLDETAKAISNFETLKASNPQAARLTELQAALSDNGVQYRSDSRFAKEYIACSVCVDLEEVVAVLKLTASLFDHSHAVWSHLHLVGKEPLQISYLLDSVEAQLVKKVFLDLRPAALLGLGDVWITAVNEIVDSNTFMNQCSNVPIRHHGRWDEDEDDDWNGYGYGRKRRRSWKFW